MLRDRRLWYVLGVAALLAGAYAYYFHIGPSLPDGRGVNWYLIPVALALLAAFPIFGKECETALAMSFMTFLIASVMIEPIMWAWRYTDVDQRIIDWIVFSFREARAASTPRGGMFLTGWVIMAHLATIAFLRIEMRRPQKLCGA